MASNNTLNLPPGYLQEDSSYQVVGVAIAFIVTNTLATVMRMFARRLQKTNLMASDILMPISLLFQLGVCTSALSELNTAWKEMVD
jgi:hypothetical protein